jgi:hypothetical protein
MEPEKGPCEHLGPIKQFLFLLTTSNCHKDAIQEYVALLNNQLEASITRLTTACSVKKRRGEKTTRNSLHTVIFLSSVSRCGQY